MDAATKKREQYQKIIEEHQEDKEEDVTEDQFNIMVQSYEDKIGELQSSIIDREIELQKLEEVSGRDSIDKNRKYDLKFLGSV